MDKLKFPKEFFRKVADVSKIEKEMPKRSFVKCEFYQSPNRPFYEINFDNASK